MPDLSLHHIDLISRDISRQEIVFSHLIHDLIDHVCCDVENEMQNGLSFADAYGKVKQKMGPRRLKEIQEETLYTVDTKYRYMKTMMKISGVAGTILLGTAALFKIQHWPGAGIMMTLGAFVLSILFLPSALGVLWKETHSSKRIILFLSAFLTGILFIFGVLSKIQHWPGSGIVLTIATISGVFIFIPSLLVSKLREEETKSMKLVYIFAAIGSICYALGLLFKIQHWPLSTTIMIIGLLLLFFVAFPWYIWHTWKDESIVSARFIFIIVGSLALIVPAALINMNLRRTYDTGFYIQMNQQQAFYNYNYAKNQYLIKGLTDSLNLSVAGKIHGKTTELLQLIDDTSIKMVAESEGKPGLPVFNPQQVRQTENGSEIQYNMLKEPFSRGPVQNYLLPGCLYRQELEAALTDYRNYLSALPSGAETKPLQGLIDASIYLPGEKPENNETSLMSGLHSLLLLKNSLLTVELSALTSIARHK
jgi:hypothetical protein